MQVDETRISFSTRVALLVPSFVNGYVTGKHSDTVPYSPHHLNSSLDINDISPVLFGRVHLVQSGPSDTHRIAREPSGYVA